MKINQLQLLFALILFIFSQNFVKAQLGINSDNSAPSTNAMLDVKSTTKGVLLPRVESDLASPTEGLLYYNNTGHNFRYYDGTAWQNALFGNQWNVNGTKISYSLGNVGIGIADPNSSAKLDIASTNSGLLVPRMTTGNRNLIANPATGLLVFDTTTNRFWFFNGVIWSQVQNTNNTRFGFDLNHASSTFSSYNLNFVDNYNLDPTSVLLLNPTTIQIMKQGLYHFSLLGYKHIENAASATATSGTFNLSITINGKEYKIIVNGVQIGGGSSWNYGSTTLAFDLFVPANSNITINAASSLNSGFLKSDTGHFFGYLIGE
jgi:hypothetical protein